MDLEALLLDIDGTLVDSNDLHADCWVESFVHFGKEVDRKLIRQQIGKGGDLLVPDTLNAREMRDFGKPLEEYRGKLWKKQYMPAVRPFPGTIEALHALRDLGLRLAFASSSDQEEVEYYVGLLEAGDLLEGSTSKKDAHLSKPSPEIFQAALDRVGSDAARTFTVGDTPYDVLASHRIPLPVVAVLSGGFERELLTKAEFLFENVPSMVKELNRLDEYVRN